MTNPADEVHEAELLEDESPFALVPHTILVDHTAGRIVVDGVDFPYVVSDDVTIGEQGFATVTVSLFADTALVITKDGDAVIYGDPVPRAAPEEPPI